MYVLVFPEYNRISYLSRYLKNVSVEGDQGKPNVEFTQDGVLKAAELKIMNLRPGVSKQLVWEEVSVKFHRVSTDYAENSRSPAVNWQCWHEVPVRQVCVTEFALRFTVIGVKYNVNPERFDGWIRANRESKHGNIIFLSRCEWVLIKEKKVSMKSIHSRSGKKEGNISVKLQIKFYRFLSEWGYFSLRSVLPDVTKITNVWKLRDTIRK